MHRRNGNQLFVFYGPAKDCTSNPRKNTNSSVDPRLHEFLDEAINYCNYYNKRFFAELPNSYKQNFFARFQTIFNSSVIEFDNGFALVCSKHHLFLVQNGYIVSHDPREIKCLIKDSIPSKENDSRDLSDLVKEFINDYGAACARQEEERFCDLSVHCREKLHKKFLELFGSESVGVYFNINLVCTTTNCCLAVQCEEYPQGVSVSDSLKELEDDLAGLFQWEVFRDGE